MSVAGYIGAVTMLTVMVVAHVAGAAEIWVYSTGAPSVAAKTIAEKFSAETGHRLSFTVAQPAVIQKRLGAGEHPDVVILPSRVVAKINEFSVFRPDSVVDLARVGIGVVVRTGMKRPDIANVEAIRKLLIEAPSIVYPDPRSGGGFTGRAIARMINEMGLTETVKPKLTLMAAIAGGVDLVANGKAAVGLFNISEILPNQGRDAGRAAACRIAELYRVHSRNTERQRDSGSRGVLHQEPCRSGGAARMAGCRHGAGRSGAISPRPIARTRSRLIAIRRHIQQRESAQDVRRIGRRRGVQIRLIEFA